MPESQGISRRDLLKRGAALGGAVVWATPVVQTLGMGRAFAQSATPVVEFSYVAMLIRCGDDPDIHFIKWEVDENAWESDPGMTPGCSPGIQPGDYDVKGFGIHSAWASPVPVSPTCLRFTIPTDGQGNPTCEVIIGVVKQGQLPCTTFGPISGQTQFTAGTNC